MKGLLRTLVVVLLLLGFGSLAVMARGGSSAALPAASYAPQAQTAAQAAAPNAPAATNRINEIALPLYVTDTLPSAATLAAYIGPGVQQVLKWNAASQTYTYFFPPSGPGTNFALVTGGVYRVALDASAPITLTFVGGVPPMSTQPGHVQSALVGGSPCKINAISVPLDRSDITNAAQLATAIGGVDQVLLWNASTQTYSYFFPPSGPGTNFAVKIGYPYRVCLNASAPAVWP